MARNGRDEEPAVPIPWIKEPGDIGNSIGFASTNPDAFRGCQEKLAQRTRERDEARALLAEMTAACEGLLDYALRLIGERATLGLPEDHPDFVPPPIADAKVAIAKAKRETAFVFWRNERSTK